MASELTNYLEDDWDDNALTGRTNPSKGWFKQFGTGGTGDVLKGVYRPRWETESGSPSASGGVLQLPDGSSTRQGVSSPSKFNTGAWEFDFQFSSTPTSGENFRFAYFAVSLANDSGSVIDEGYNTFYSEAGAITLERRDPSSNTTVISGGSWGNDSNSHTAKTTRDSYGGWELFNDASSQGTGTDTALTDAIRMMIGNGLNQTVDIDNLVLA